MALSMGLDFGTSNSSAALADGDSLHLVPLDPLAADPRVLRTLLYLAQDGGREYGQAALDRYLRDNIGRAVKLERRFVGTISMTHSGTGTMLKDTYALVDVNEPGRLFQSIKSFLPDRSFQATSVFGERCSIEDLIAILAAEILRRAEDFAGQPVTRLTVGRPVRFSLDPESDRLARERQEVAFARLKLPSLQFLEEPVAAALEFARDVTRERTALVFDFGGGTLDVTLITAGAGRSRVLATGGVPVGGDLLDRRIVEAHLLRHFGEDATVGPKRLPVPRTIFARLLNWQSMALLNRPETLGTIRAAIEQGDQPRQLRALLTLVSRNYGLDLFRTVEESKRTLSERSFTVLEFMRDGIDVRQPLSRADFESAIHAQAQEIERCLLETLARAGLDAARIDTVVTTGGSSRIPFFRELLRRAFPRAELSERNAFTSVAAGLALAGLQSHINRVHAAG